MNKENKNMARKLNVEKRIGNLRTFAERTGDYAARVEQIVVDLKKATKGDRSAESKQVQNVAKSATKLARALHKAAEIRI